MNSILRKAMVPAAVAVAMVGFIGAFGSTPTASAFIEGDICHYDTDATETMSDGQGNTVHVVEHGETYGLVFRVAAGEDSGGDDDNDIDNQGPNVNVEAEAETGAALITSYAEDVDGGDNIQHRLVANGNGALNQVVDTHDPDDIDDADGHGINSINGWLNDSGYSSFADNTDDICDVPDDDCEIDVGDNDGDEVPCEDHWGFVDFECVETGYFWLHFNTPDDTAEESLSVKFYCPGDRFADSAEIDVQRSIVETDPTNVAPAGFGESRVTVTVWDDDGERLDGVEVIFSTDNCHFDAADDDDDITPAGGGSTVTVETDTDSASYDQNIVADENVDEAGTAEVILDCTGPDGEAGVANITAVVDRTPSGRADIILEEEVTVVGETSETGLTLTLTPDEIDCGDTILAVATAVDALGQPVSDGTKIFFTTDNDAGVVGGAAGAQGDAATDDGEASVLIATGAGDPGTHTVIASTKDSAGRVLSQVSDTYTCEGEVDAVAPPAPTVAPPATGTGSITPPNTGDAGLASASSSASLFVIVGAAAFVLAGLASIRFARN